MSCCMRIPGTGGSMGITVKPLLTATSYYIHFFGSLLAGLSRRGNRRLHRRERPLLAGNFFGRLAKRPYIFLLKKALVNTVEPRLTATSVIRSPVNTANFFLAYW